MKRKKIIAGNWKMNLDYFEAMKLVAEIKGMVDSEVRNEVSVILFPPHVYLHSVVQQVKGFDKVQVGAQDCSANAGGAFTGEVSAAMVAAVGGSHVLIGHSERRKYFNEDAQLLSQKLEQAMAHGLTPVFCCGEDEHDRASGNYFRKIAQQLEEVIMKLPADQVAKMVIAYEPVWAIGTGLTATPAQAGEVHLHIRNLLAATYSEPLAESMTLLYGGSCNAANAQALFGTQGIDGGLIGGASLKSREFVDIVKMLA